VRKCLVKGGSLQSAGVRVLTWNLFHGRAQPVAGRPLLVEFAATLAGWEWDVALLQEVPPWWPPLLAHAAGAQHARALTSRNELLALRRAIASRNPDLLGANGGGSNALLARGPLADHREVELTTWPERRVAHGARLGDGTWVVNLHASTDPKERTRDDVAGALEAAHAWAGAAPLVFGGDFNLTNPAAPGLTRVAGRHVDHVFVRGLAAEGAGELLDAGTLSDHRPIAVNLRPAPGV
jgi:endonuclease/exonuclease/phosphatase family metal-dependent hydrolase